MRRGFATGLATAMSLIGFLLPSLDASVQTYVNWNQYLENRAHSSRAGAATAVTTSNAAGMAESWTWTPPTYADRGQPLGTNHIEVSPVVHNGVIYVGTTSGHFYAL